ncbi:MAG: hypothetical protein JO108_05885 [Acidobacteriaceae bacterium]|nr:hypothetical protein [Acidobacteriaceae bacterium]
MMANEESRKSTGTNALRGDHASSPKTGPREIPAAALLSFLKELRGVQTWTEKDLTKILRIGLTQAKEAIAVLQLQGYIHPAGNTGKWRVTEQGEIVSEAKPPRFTRQSIENALAGIHDRIKAANENPATAYRITEAVAFGDFLRDAARVQAADVGIRLVPKSDSGSITSAPEHAAELDFLRELRGKTALLHVVPYEDWMGFRSHQRLL